MTNKITAIKYDLPDVPSALRKTVQLIGQAIREGARYYPIRNHAAQVAARAPRKNYIRQLHELYKDFVKRWRYVRDPVGVELLHTTGPAIFGQILGFDAPRHRGIGDCDDATVALGSMAESIGLSARIVTIASPGKHGLFTHVYPELLIPQVGWIAADPVAYPAHGIGYNPPAQRRAIWDLDGNLIQASGDLPPEFFTMAQKQGEEKTMSLAGLNYHSFHDFGLENFGMAGTDDAPPLDWSSWYLKDFGAYVDNPYPMINADQMGLMMEYGDDDVIGYCSDGQPVVRTKVLEMDPQEVAYLLRSGQPRPGTVALGDDGTVYQWEELPGLGGWFRRLFKKIGRGIKKGFRAIGKGVKWVVRGIGKVARKLIKKLPGGKYLIKIYDRVKTVAMKAVRPLVKLIGKIGKFVAPIAAIIPGYGPAIAAVLYKAGTIAKLIKVFDVKVDKKGRPIFKSGHQARSFRRALAKEGAKVARGRAARRREIAQASSRVRSARPFVRPAYSKSPYGEINA